MNPTPTPMPDPNARRTTILWLVFVLSWGSVGLALVLQHGFGMEPCAWCTIQRVVYLAVGALALVGALVPVRPVRLVAAALAGIASLSGVAAALYQQLVAAKSAACGFSWADQLMFRFGLDESLPWLFKASAPCNEANIPLAGVPFAVWSAILFAVLALLCVRFVLGRGARP